MRPPLLPPAASIFQRPLEAYLPGSETPSFFQEASIAGNGNCGFTLLGITRDEFADALAPLVDDAEARAFIWEEIYEALTTQAELWSGPTTEWQVFFNAVLSLDTEIQASLVALGAQYGLDHSLQLDDFIILLEELGHEADAERLRQLGLDVALQRAHFENYCKRQDVFLSYLERLRINESGRMLWLGNKSAVLYAKIKNITLYIWHRFEEDSNQLNLESSHVPELPDGQVIHGLRTGGGTHYNFLLSQDGVELDEEYNFDAGKDSFAVGLDFLFAANKRSLEKADEEFFPEEPDEEFFLKEQIQKSFSKHRHISGVKYLADKPARIFYTKTSGSPYEFFDLDSKIFTKPTERIYLPKDQSVQLALIVREQQQIDTSAVEALSLGALDQSAQFESSMRV